MAMKLSTGKVAFPIHFDNGDVENVYINPHDSGLQQRIKNFENSIQKRLDKINFEKHKNAFVDGFDMSNIDFTKLMSMTEEELEKITKQTNAIEEMDREIEEKFCEEIDAVFNSDVSSKLFKHAPPLAMVEVEDGKFELYILHAFKGLAEEIQKYGNKVNNATNKYIEKYSKK